MTTPFPHQHTAHCESGVLSTLLRQHGYDLNEAMVFGLASALTFVYLPVVKLAGMPLISYRIQPQSIIKRTCRALGIRLSVQKFADPQQGMAALDRVLASGGVAGLQTSVFWLPYFPPDMRFHFNAHNLLVYGRENQDYLISDPVFETVQRCPAEDLMRARFAKGALAPKGLMYTVADAGQADTLPQRLPELIRPAIVRNARHMLAPLFFVGVRGIRSVAKRIAALPRQPENYRKLYLGHIVRMQEEIGTGGAGFRYLYGYFLEQAAHICAEPRWQQAAQDITVIGDQWRQFAADCVQQCRKPQADGYAALAAQLESLAERERQLWHSLKDTARP